jgi:hypothetical protein
MKRRKCEQDPRKGCLRQESAAGYLLSTIKYFHNEMKQSLVSRRFYCRKHILEAARGEGKPVLWPR